MGNQVSELSGLSMTDKRKRIGAYKDTALHTPTQIVRQVDDGMWKGPALMTDAERALVKYIKQQKTMNPNDRMQATRGSFIEAVENAYFIGKGRR